MRGRLPAARLVLENEFQCRARLTHTFIIIIINIAIGIMRKGGAICGGRVGGDKHTRFGINAIIIYMPFVVNK